VVSLILLDANLLVYANDADSPHHREARSWFEDTINAPARVGFPWPTLLAFVRLLGNPRITRSPIPLEQTWRRVQEWLSLPNAWIPSPTERHREVLTHLLDGESRPGLVNDAHLAALAIEHGLTLCSADRDFARFPGLRWENPLAGH
jgi:uncharacterized protein